MNEVMHAILTRSSIRGFTDEPVSKEDRDQILKAGLASPSAVNRQFWHFSVMEDKAMINRLEKEHVEYIMNSDDEASKERIAGRNYRTLFNAPLFIVISSKDGKGSVDAGIAVQNMVLAAQSLGLSSTIIGGIGVLFESEMREKYETLLRFPEGYKFMIGVVIGHKAVEKDPHELDYSKITFIE